MLPNGSYGIQKPVSNEKYWPCILIDEENLVCYVGAANEIHHLRAEKEVISTKLVFPLQPRPEAQSENRGSTKREISVGDLTAQKDPSGNIVVAWQYNLDATESINLLFIKEDGQTRHYVVKEFARFDSLFDLRAFVLSADTVEFLYTNYSEKYFSLSDTGSIQKLWALLWQNGKVISDRQLSRKGKEHTTEYIAWYRGNGMFDVAWREQYIGSFFGPREKLKVGEFSVGDKDRKLKELGSIPIDDWSKETGGLVVGLIPVPSMTRDFHVLAGIVHQPNYNVYKKIDRAGNVVGEIKVSGNIYGFGYNPATGLFSYINGDLRPLIKRSDTIKGEIYWTDLDGWSSKEKLELPHNAILLTQPVGDCFYWLEPVSEKLKLRKQCHQSAR